MVLANRTEDIYTKVRGFNVEIQHIQLLCTSKRKRNVSKNEYIIQLNKSNYLLQGIKERNRF